jgi:hypothetical protein
MDGQQFTCYTSYMWESNIYLLKLEGWGFKVTSIEKTNMYKLSKKPREFINEMGLPPRAYINYKVGENMSGGGFAIFYSRLQAYCSAFMSPYQLIFYKRSGKYCDYSKNNPIFKKTGMLITWKDGVITKYRCWKYGKRDLTDERNFSVETERRNEIKYILRFFGGWCRANKNKIKRFYKYNGDKIETDDEILSECSNRWTFKYILKQMKKTPSLKHNKFIRIYSFQNFIKKIEII